MHIFIKLFQYFGGIFLGWGLGANDSANVFGMAVGSHMVSWRKAAVLTASFVILGAILQGRAGIETLAHDLGTQKAPESKVHSEEAAFPHKDADASEVNTTDLHKQRMFRNAMIMSLSAAFTVAIMTFLRLPVSTSQAVVGAIIGVNLLKGSVQWGGLLKVVLCWIGTPIGGIIFTFIFYYFFKWIIDKWRPSVIVYDRVMTILLIVTGCYGAYALGANNVANVSAVFVSSGQLTVVQAEWFGAIAIAIGIITYSKPVMMTVGSDIVKLDAFMAFITVLALSVTVWIYALIGVPVSTTQAVVGAVLGFGIIKGAHTINYKTLLRISMGWISTPIIGGAFAAAAYFISNLHYVPT